ncbi:MAG: YHYH protein [Verrucomicrobiota bacterium]
MKYASFLLFPALGLVLLAAQSAQVRMTTDGAYRIIESNGIPEHTTGRFPNRNNPNQIRAQQHRYRVPLHPQVASRITPLHRQPFGVALNGVPFDPGTAEFWQRDRSSGWNYEALSGKISLGLDQNNAHVQPTGAYHYHGLPQGLVVKLGGEKKMTHLGYAADGFPVYGSYAYSDPKDSRSALKKVVSSYRLKSGSRPSGPGGVYDGTFVQDYEYVPGAGDLDACNGRFGVTPDHPEGIYHYYITETYPFIPRFFRGTPDASFARRGPGSRPGQNRQQPPHMNPQQMPRHPHHPPPSQRPRF